MFLCERCQKGRTDICKYFLANYLEDGGAVTRCPEFEEEDHEQSEDLWDVDWIYPEGQSEAEEAEEAGGETDCHDPCGVSQ